MSFLIEKPLINYEDVYLGVVPLDDNIEVFKRRRIIEKTTILHQSFANFWVMFRFIDVPRDKFFVKIGGKYHEGHGCFYVFLPRFTMAEWVFKPGIHEYDVIASYDHFNPYLPKSPIILSFDKPCEIKGESCIADILKAHTEIDKFNFRKRSYTAEQLKSFLDHHFTEPHSFDEISEAIHIPYSTMTMSFKKHYSITPIQYRNTLRTFEAMRLIRQNHSVTQAGFEAGFCSLTQYNQHFHRTFNAPPSAFR